MVRGLAAQNSSKTTSQGNLIDYSNGAKVLPTPRIAQIHRRKGHAVRLTHRSSRAVVLIVCDFLVIQNQIRNRQTLPRIRNLQTFMGPNLACYSAIQIDNARVWGKLDECSLNTGTKSVLAETARALERCRRDCIKALAGNLSKLRKTAATWSGVSNFDHTRMKSSEPRSASCTFRIVMLLAPSEITTFAPELAM